MAISFNSALGIHEQAMYLRSQRAEVLGNNLANVDTPELQSARCRFLLAARSSHDPTELRCQLVKSMGQPLRADRRCAPTLAI